MRSLTAAPQDRGKNHNMRVVFLSRTGGPALDLAAASLRRHHGDANVEVLLTQPGAELSSRWEGAVHRADRWEIGGARYIDLFMALGQESAEWAAIGALLAGIESDETVLVLDEHTWTVGTLEHLISVEDDSILALARRSNSPEISLGGWLPNTLCIAPGPRTRATGRAWVETVSNLVRSGERALISPWETAVPVAQHVGVSTDPALRLAPLSVDQFKLDRIGETFTIDGHALRLAHFHGFDINRPWWYSAAFDIDPLVPLSESPALSALCSAYVTELEKAGARRSPAKRRSPRPPHLSPGLPASRSLHDLIREEWAEEGQPPPNVFDPDQVEAFWDWFRDPGPESPTKISRAADTVWRERSDLRAAFPNVARGERQLFERWMWTHGLNEGYTTLAMLGPAPAPSAKSTPHRHSKERIFGVNLVGYHHAEAGLGVAVRRVGAALDAAGIPWAAVAYDRTASRMRSASKGMSTSDTPNCDTPNSGTRTSETENNEAPDYWFNLLLITADQLPLFAHDVGADFFADRYNIGIWYWETDVLPRHTLPSFALVDEVWAATDYLREVFAEHTAKPVELVPLPLEFAPVTDSLETRARLGLDERFTFLFTFDFLSIAERKNPEGLIAAYKKAFGPNDGVRLILKSINGSTLLDQREALHFAIEDRPDIELWDRYLDGNDRIELVAAADCYVSLHRSEGLGLTMAEAMAVGTPVIATGYSGNLSFMSEDSALLVDFTEVTIGPGSYYPANGHWAEPDLDHAATLMRSIVEDESQRARLSAAGIAEIQRHSAESAGAIMAERLRRVFDDH
jgi:glycosyltransferase involved in cell wall biosynthesis